MSHKFFDLAGLVMYQSGGVYRLLKAFKEAISILDVRSIVNPQEIQKLRSWEERGGKLLELHEHDGMLVAKLSKTLLVLPLELKSDLQRFLGQKVAILRTDVRGKEYLVSSFSKK